MSQSSDLLGWRHKDRNKEESDRRSAHSRICHYELKLLHIIVIFQPLDPDEDLQGGACISLDNQEKMEKSFHPSFTDVPVLARDASIHFFLSNPIPIPVRSVSADTDPILLLNE